MPRSAAPTCFLAVLLLTGCGAKIGDVRGKLVYEGKPVTAGTVLFTPKVPDDQFEAGRPAVGVPNENGEFRLMTNDKDDGALVGVHNVLYMPPQPTETNDKAYAAQRMKEVKQFGQLRVKPGYTVEVKPGVNDIVVELTK